ncbi:MAB_1171c family putative transporter [Actinocorallia herbida]|uniref:MAB_1171c family putative transporter n=1 Tax=Actinocorallia herbida TaxID=58109 RepID=UPI001476AD31|nr:MAB_1171c family putative transporter [Actinocorallia herbida]
MDGLLFAGAGVAFGWAGVRLRGLRRGPVRAGQGELCALLMAFGLAFVLMSGRARAVEGRVFPHLGWLLADVCALAVALCTVAYLLRVTRSPREARTAIRARIVAYTLAIAGMSDLFLGSPVSGRGGALGELYRERPMLGGYADIFLVMLGVAMVDLLRTGLRHAGRTSRAALRLGLWSVSAGAVLGLVHLAERFVFVQAQLFGFEPPLPVGTVGDLGCRSPIEPLGCLFSVTLPAVAVLLIAVGMTLPAWGPARTAPVRGWKDRRPHRTPASEARGEAR